MAKTPTSAQAALVAATAAIVVERVYWKCYTFGINTHEETGIATAAALLWSLPHNGTL